MKKSIIALMALGLIVVSQKLVGQTETPGQKYACVWIQPDPNGAVVYCEQQGTFCATASDCVKHS
jgi:hypothetical protein